MSTHISRLPIAGLITFLICGTALPQSSTRQLPALTLAKNVIYNEMHPSQTNNVHWKYRLVKTVSGRQEIRTVVETQSGSLDRLIAVGGRPLSDAQGAAETQRILKFSRSTAEQRKAEEQRRKDAAQCNAFLKMIPDAFVFEYAGRSENALKLTFKPNPRFQAPSREGKVLQQMAGEMWVDARQQRLISISGKLINEVKFGGGLLGHLEKNGQFIVKRAEIAPGDWEVTELTVNMQGKALLFKSISVQQHEVHSNFEPVPENLTVADAANLLLRDSLLAANRIAALP